MTIKKVFYRSPHNYDVEEASREASVRDFGESLTVQSMAEEADINVMMKRFGVTGKLPDNPRVPTFGDFEGVDDYASALRQLNAAQDAFMEFPAEVRARFENNPQRVLEFISNESNFSEAVKLGLMKEGAKAPVPVSPRAEPEAKILAPGAPAPVVT